MKFKFQIQNETGMHARPAGLFVQAAAKSQDTIEVTAKGKTVNGKSIMGLMGLGLENGDEMEISIEGPQAEKTKVAIENVLNTFLH